MRLLYLYGIKVWLTSVVLSFILSQAPLYYFFHNSFDRPGDSYASIFIENGLEWLKVLGFLIIPWLLIFACIKLLYKPEWSLKYFKWTILFLSEFLAIFVLLDSISISNSTLLMPTSIMLIIFAISNGISILLYDVRPIFTQWFEQSKTLE